MDLGGNYEREKRDKGKFGKERKTRLNKCARNPFSTHTNDWEMILTAGLH